MSDDEEYKTRVCEVCGEGFTEDSWEERHYCHEYGCENAMNPMGCDCDIVVHRECCPICNEDISSV